MSNKKILFVVNQDRYFVTHRLHLAKLAIKNNFEVGLICSISDYKEVIESAGIKLFNWQLTRDSINPINEITSIYHLFKIIKKFNPDIVHAVTLKSVIYCSIISKFQYFKPVYALGGLGFIFTSNSKKARILRIIVTNSLKFLFDKKSIVILQNPENVDLLVRNNIVNENKVKLIRGAGVDVDYFIPGSNKEDIPLVILPARMLWDKGIGEFVACARRINKQGGKARFALVGDTDNDNPEAISKKQLQEWQDDGVVEWWGYQDNMPKVYQQTDIVCFPSSYGEGLPKSLLEAASCAIPIVAFDIPGCREIVQNNINGFLIEAKNQEKLFNAVKKLLEDKNLSVKFGNAGRDLVIKNFSQKQVGEETLQIWEKMLN